MKSSEPFLKHYAGWIIEIIATKQEEKEEQYEIIKKIIEDSEIYKALKTREGFFLPDDNKHNGYFLLFVSNDKAHVLIELSKDVISGLDRSIHSKIRIRIGIHVDIGNLENTGYKKKVKGNIVNVLIKMTKLGLDRHILLNK